VPVTKRRAGHARVEPRPSSTATGNRKRSRRRWLERGQEGERWGMRGGRLGSRDQRRLKRLGAPLWPSNIATATLKEARKNCISVFQPKVLCKNPREHQICT
jgi:hypothetical protein